MRRALIVLSLLASTIAHADVPEQPSGGERYAGRIVAADAGSLFVFAIGSYYALAAGLGGQDTETQAIVCVTASIVGYAAAAPLLHLHRGNPRGAMRSGVARIGLPIAGASLAYLSDRHGEGDRPILGAVTGMGIAMVLDWTVLAKMPTSSASPFVAPGTDGGVQAGIAGTF
jgi:hypothetical protein